ncbi:MAG: F0F1 ATP synthase subunit delta [Endomicrobium sp.]|jgi:F0F1-type ATP synthase delta subunit|nr:F0F1 ATP synthase subunit delta [Endomicrobium sp.]
MEKLQIEKLAKSIVSCGKLSEEGLKWIFLKFSKQELKFFIYLLHKEIKNNTVVVSFAGELDNESKSKISAMFPNKQVLFKRDDKNIIGGLCLRYGDYFFDYSVLGMMKKITSSIRENL